MTIASGASPIDLNEAGNFRKWLFEQGYSPLPIETGGKRCLYRNWPERARSGEFAYKPIDPAHSGTGIECNGLRPVDVDCDRAEHAGQAHGCLMSLFPNVGPVRFRENSNRFLVLFRAAEGSPRKLTIGSKGCGIEILGRGQQFVARGLHPTGAPYRWDRPLPPLAELPAVTEEEIRRFLAEAASLLSTSTPSKIKIAAPSARVPHHAALTASIDDVRAALQAIPNPDLDWDEWKRILMAAWTATSGSDEGREACRAWSETSAKHKEEDFENSWQNISRSPPTKIGAGTLFFLARDAQRTWTPPSGGVQAAKAIATFKAAGRIEPPNPHAIADPDMTVLRLGRRAPPPFPLDLLGEHWHRWAVDTATAAACPVDNVAAPLLASASALIGHARWAQATPGWAEPPHLWLGVVGDSGTGKSPGADTLLRDVLPEIEHRMLGDFPDRRAQWRAEAEAHAARVERWKGEVRKAQKEGSSPPPPPSGDLPAEPQAPRLRQNDVTIEKVAALLAGAAPKGLLMVRDELSGWLLGLNAYNDAGRAFWIEAYGGRPYRVERQKHPEPIVVPRLAVAVTGGTQPEKLAELFADADDGLLARIAWAWPNPLPFRLGRTAPAKDWAISALDRLRLLDLVAVPDPTVSPRPLMVPLATAMQPEIEAFGQEMQRFQETAGGLMRSTYGKARGLVLRLSLVLEMLHWCGSDGMASPPLEIGEVAYKAAEHLVSDYWLPMAERVYGDAATRPVDRNAATLARWIVKTRPAEVHVRKLQREVRLPGLGDAEAIKAAAAALVEAGWLIPPEIGFSTARRVSYAVSPRVWEVAP